MEESATAIPVCCGIGLRAPHCREIVDSRPAVGWVEVHSENYYGGGGQPHYFLERIRSDYPLSLHGVGLGLGSSEPVDLEHVRKLARLIERYEPGLVSEHLCWSAADGRHLNDLLPLPYTEETLEIVCANITRAQDVIGRRLLFENPSSYVALAGDMAEWEFLGAMCARTGCELLLDVNNIFVSASNLGFEPMAYLAGIPAQYVRQIHLAGHSQGRELLVDTHDRPVPDSVWSLYEAALSRVGPVATMIERDDEIPPLAELLTELDIARSILARTTRRAA